MGTNLTNSENLLKKKEIIIILSSIIIYHGQALDASESISNGFIDFFESFFINVFSF